MSYTALYRKWRPVSFEEVKGQDHIVRTLKNQIMSGRIGHAYLFCGTRGTGKTSIAKIFARAVNCEHPVEGSPCGNCGQCRQIGAGASLNVVEIDAASNNGVENIRELREQVQYPPTEGRYRVYIIDEVHMLSIGAFNALLKTLEEPPEYVIFILATTEAHKIPITILSRCQRYDFKRIAADTIADRLRELTKAEQIQAQEPALRYVAKMADGSMRDALSLLDQCSAFHFGETLTYDNVLEVLGAVDTGVFSRLFRAVAEKKTTDAVYLVDELIVQGRELTQFVNDFVWYLRNLLLLKTAGDTKQMLDLSADSLKLLMEEGELTDADTLMRYIRIFSELSGQLRFATQKRVLLEIALIKLTRPSMERNLDSVLQRLSEIEGRLDKLPAELSELQAGAALKKPGEARELNPPDEAVGGGREPVTVVLAKAEYEDLMLLRGEWKQIIKQMTGPLKAALSGTEVEPDGEGSMIIVFTNINNYGIISRPTALEEIRTFVEKTYEKAIQFKTRLHETGQVGETNYLNEEDLKAIHEVIVEED